MKKRKTPRQKKDESLARDRRTTAEYPKAARKGFPLAKAIAHRRTRRKLKIRAGSAEDELREPAEAARARKSGWRKWGPDIPLRDHIERQREKRSDLAHRKPRRRAP